MKKFLSIILAVMMLFTCAVALADTCATDADDAWHDSDPTGGESEMDVTITITGLESSADPEDDGEDGILPVEFHVRVIWDTQDGTFDATKVMTAGATAGSSSEAIAWNCDTLEYELQGDKDPGSYSYDPWDDADGTEPSCRFEVTNASTPNLDIKAQASAITGDWNDYLVMTSTLMNTETAGSDSSIVTVLAVEDPGDDSNYGTGKASRALEASAWEETDNTWIGTYTFVWDYAKLAQLALDNYEAGTGSQDLTETFVVTINPSSPAQTLN